jgi:hypothetical protein
MAVLLIAVLALGLYMPAFLSDVLDQISHLFPGGGACPLSNCQPWCRDFPPILP